MKRILLCLALLSFGAVFTESGLKKKIYTIEEFCELSGSAWDLNERIKSTDNEDDKKLLTEQKNAIIKTMRFASVSAPAQENIIDKFCKNAIPILLGVTGIFCAVAIYDYFYCEKKEEILLSSE